ncbi:MAG: hypothetical protein ACLQM6_03875 [Acidobacteriaceae bacterium]
MTTQKRLHRSILKNTWVRLVAFISLASGVVTLLGYFGFYPKKSQPVTSSIVGVRLPEAEKPQSESAVPNRASTSQTSFGAKSPNISHVKRSVKIQYDAAVPEHASEKIVPIPTVESSVLSSTTQISTGDQSANINGVGSDVNINYGAPSQGQDGNKPGE